MTTYSVYIHSTETTAFVVKARTKADAKRRALERWAEGEEGDMPVSCDIDNIEVEKNS
jgi:hypothetical protein